jgi:hypothetical protein
MLSMYCICKPKTIDIPSFPFPFFLSLSLSLCVSKSFRPQQNGAPSQILPLVSQLLPTQFIAKLFPPLISRIQCLIFLFGDGCDFRKSRKKSPNRLVVDEAINDDNSVVAMHPETMKKLHFFRGDTILINVSDLREFCVLF